MEHPHGRIIQQAQAGEAGVVLHSLEGDKVECMICIDFPTTNNEAEYKALIAGVDLAKVV